jgi:hypothetical protein
MTLYLLVYMDKHMHWITKIKRMSSCLEVSRYDFLGLALKKQIYELLVIKTNTEASR